VVKIYDLKDKPLYLDTIVKWIFNEWGGNYDYIRSCINCSIISEVIPKTFVAEVNGECAGCISILRCDLQSRQDLYPWLGDLFVNPKYRNKGIGTYLIEYSLSRVIEYINCTYIYMYTLIAEYYEKRGWVYIENVYNSKGEIFRLYKHAITKTSPALIN